MKIKSSANLGTLFNMLTMTRVAEKAAAEELLRISDPYVPMLSGDLSGSGEVHSSMSGSYVEWNLPYALFVYQGVSMAGVPRKATGKPLNYGKQYHPLAGPRWDERAINDHPGNLESVVMGVFNSAG